MKKRICRFQAGGAIRWGELVEGRVTEILPDPFGPYAATGLEWRSEEVRFVAPCAPGKIVAVGVNYADHAAEFGKALPEEPLIFLKPSSAVIGPGEAIQRPRASKQVDFEGELAVVIGRRTKNIRAAKAKEHVLGLTIMNDVTARDLQRRDGQWSRAKGFDSFAPLGPWIACGIDPRDLAIETFVNGERRQASRTRHLVFGVWELVAYVSGIMTLEPGDVISTGTPSGVGPLQKGDRVEVRVEGIGSLVNPVAS